MGLILEDAVGTRIATFFPYEEMSSELETFEAEVL